MFKHSKSTATPAPTGATPPPTEATPASRGKPARSMAIFTSEEKGRIFKSMVVGELEAGFLRHSRREELIRYAAHLGLSEFQAMLLIAEAQHQAGQIEPLRSSRRPR